MISAKEDCVIARWDADNNGVWENGSVKEVDSIRLRLQDRALETVRGATGCTGRGREKMTDPVVMKIKAFQVKGLNFGGYPPLLTLRLCKVNNDQPQRVVRATYSITGLSL